MKDQHSQGQATQFSLRKQLTIFNEDYFQAILESLQSIHDFEELTAKCQFFCKQIGDLSCETLTLDGNIDMEIDNKAVVLLPDNISISTLSPIAVPAYGDCMPHSGSVLAFGDASRPMEVRARICMELVLYMDVYLNPDHLKQGSTLSDAQARSLPTTYCMFSDMYIPGSKLDKSKIKQTFIEEVKSVLKPNTYMGIWQIFALSSILHKPVQSVYPQRGNPNVRKDLNRLIYPRSNDSTGACTEIAFLMWTSTRNYMGRRHWVPNHFVP